MAICFIYPCCAKNQRQHGRNHARLKYFWSNLNYLSEHDGGFKFEVQQNALSRSHWPRHEQPMRGFDPRFHMLLQRCRTHSCNTLG
jgi:hypothetical protein